ncbi:MAG: type II toxin-antitoxin system VapC family toxin [Chromatiales bacterium]|nr:type II toxin-antitoxin system VapC family toxin [Gammaproteobacteria bacterium]MCP5352095.1 type II toxin-antitoxin system VapC family toxin [Chromatiales bacterium]
MNLLLDIHVWLRTLTVPERIGAEAFAALSDPANTLYLSAASSWEIAIKYRLGKLPLPEPPDSFVPARLIRDGILPLAVEHRHALAVATLPDHHADPFDRLLVCQAGMDGMHLVSHDKTLSAYQAHIIWA